MMYDVVIIGAGPAGISAGIYAASRGKKVLITEKNTVGGLIGKVSTVTHYAGIMTEETGSSFAKRLKIQAENTGIDIIYEEVTQVELQGSIKKVFTKDGAYDAKKIVLANGTTPRKLNIPGEAELTGKGMGMNAQRDGRKYTDNCLFSVDCFNPFLYFIRCITIDPVFHVLLGVLCMVALTVLMRDKATDNFSCLIINRTQHFFCWNSTFY